MREFVERIKTDEDFNYGVAFLSAVGIAIMRVVFTVLCTRGFIVNTLTMATGLKIFMYPLIAITAWEIFTLPVQFVIHRWLRKIFPYWQEVEEKGHEMGFMIFDGKDDKKD